MPGPFHYGNIEISASITLIQDGREWEIPFGRSEGWVHIALKVSIAIHLLHWGYPKETIKFEHHPRGYLSRYRPDVFAQATDELPTFWFECLGVHEDKLKDIRAYAEDCRVVHAVDSEGFRRIWNDLIWDEDGSEIPEPTAEQVDAQRRKSVPYGTELWGFNTTLPAGYITLAARHDIDGQFTYMDTGEGYSIRDIRGFSHRRSRIAPLLQGKAGSADWNGMSRRT